MCGFAVVVCDGQVAVLDELFQIGAQRRIFFDLIGQVVQAGVGGAISGGVMGGVVNGVNGMANAAYNRYNQQLVRENDVKNTPVLETNPQEGPVQSQNEGEIDSSIPEATRQAVEMLVRGEEISGNQAARIAESEEAVALLSQLTGEEVNTDAPISRVKSDIRALASREGRTSGEAGVNSRATQSGAQTQVQTQVQQNAERPTAQRAYDILRVQQAATTLGESGSRALTAAYDGSVDAGSFYAGFAAYYEAGVSGMDMGRVRNAFEYAVKLHEGQKRRDGSPYVTHCVATAEIIAEQGLDEDSVVAALLNVVLDWLFIFPLGWGVMGAAFATAISVSVGGVIVVVYLSFFARTLRFCPLKRSRKSLRLSLRNVGYQCRIGSSALLGEATLAMLMFVGNLTFMHYLGDDGVGAFGIACYYIPFVFMVGNAIAQSAQPIISYNFGAGVRERVIEAAQIALATAVVCGAAVTAVFIGSPRLLVGLFLDPATHAARIAIEGLPWFALGFICFIVNLTAIGYYQSLERVGIASGFALLRGFVFLVPSFLFMPRLCGTEGIWLAMPLSELLTALVILGVSLWRRQRIG